MKIIFLIPLFFLICCGIANSKIKPTLETLFGEDSDRPKFDSIKLNENCKNIIESQIQNEFKKEYKWYGCWKNKNDDTMMAFFENVETKEERDNTIWIYLDQKCNILEKHVVTFKHPKNQ